MFGFVLKVSPACVPLIEKAAIQAAHTEAIYAIRGRVSGTQG